MGRGSDRDRVAGRTRAARDSCMMTAERMSANVLQKLCLLPRLPAFVQGFGVKPSCSSCM